MNVTDGEFFLYKNRDRCEKGYMLLREIAYFRKQLELVPDLALNNIIIMDTWLPKQNLACFSSRL